MLFGRNRNENLDSNNHLSPEAQEFMNDLLHNPNFESLIDAITEFIEVNANSGERLSHSIPVNNKIPDGVSRLLQQHFQTKFNIDTSLSLQEQPIMRALGCVALSLGHAHYRYKGYDSRTPRRDNSDLNLAIFPESLYKLYQEMRELMIKDDLRKLRKMEVSNYDIFSAMRSDMPKTLIEVVEYLIKERLNEYSDAFNNVLSAIVQPFKFSYN